MVIYKITINGRCYVGSSKDFETRKKEHLRHLRRNKHHSPFLQNQYNKYGNPEFSIIEVVSSQEEMFILEEKWIAKIGVLNAVKTAVGGDRVSHLTGEKRKEWKRKLKARPKNHNTSCFQNLNEDERQERLEVWSECKKGSKNGRYKHSNPVLQIDRKTGEVIKEWLDVSEAGRAGYNYRYVLFCCKNKPGFNSHKGYIWRWKEAK